VIVLFLVVDGVGATASDAVDDESHAIARTELPSLLLFVVEDEGGILLDYRIYSYILRFVKYYFEVLYYLFAFDCSQPIYLGTGIICDGFND